MLRNLLRMIVTLAVCAGIFWAVFQRLGGLQQAAIDGPAETTGLPEDERLFRELLEAGLVSPRPDGGLDRAPPDFLLLQRIDEDRDLTPEQATRRANEQRLLRGLDYSAVGSIVRQQIGLWNDTRRIAAIRDDRPQPERDVRNRWRGFNERGRPLSAGDVVPETYGFIHDGVLRPGFSDWASIPGASGPVTFRTTVEVAERTDIIIQVIGDLVDVPAGARVRTLEGEFDWTCFTDRPPLDMRNREVDGVELPEPEGEVIPALAHALTMTVEPGAARELSITVSPGVNCSPRVHGLALRLYQDHQNAYTRYGWRPVGRGRPPNSFAILTADGVYLTDPDGSGTPTDATFELGLLPIVGTGRGDSFSISGLLASTRLPPEGIEVRLTIDSELQLLAQRSIEEGVDRFPARDRYRPERKSALVLMDADSGAILAAANHPTVPPGVHPWDYTSFSQAFPLRDPASIIAWEVIDKHNTPGSTFKPVTALSLMMAEDPAFRQAVIPIIHGLDNAGLRRATGLSFGSSSYVAYEGARRVPNFGGATLGQYTGRARRDPRCAEVPIDNVFGLRRAAQFSLNAWFARMALMMEQPAIDEYAARLETNTGDRFALPELNLTRVSRLLGIDDRQRMDLAINLPESVGLNRILSDNTADILYPQLARSTLAEMEFGPGDWGVRPLVMYTVALNGIGQTVSASPLHMAQAISAISSRNRVFAHLLSRWGDMELATPEPLPLPIDPDLLQYLRDGMKAVPEVGTAPRIFDRPLACRMYGKTGTAEIDAARSYNTGWFVGWREPEYENETRISFACMMTHATGGMRFGGSSCGPVIGTIMNELEARRVADEEAAAASATEGADGDGDSGG